MLSKVEDIARTITKRVKQLESAKRPKRIDSDSQIKKQLALCQKPRLCMNRAVSAGVTTTIPEAVAVNDLLHEILALTSHSHSFFDCFCFIVVFFFVSCV